MESNTIPHFTTLIMIQPMFIILRSRLILCSLWGGSPHNPFVYVLQNKLLINYHGNSKGYATNQLTKDSLKQKVIP